MPGLALTLGLVWFCLKVLNVWKKENEEDTGVCTRACIAASEKDGASTSARPPAV